MLLRITRRSCMEQWGEPQRIYVSIDLVDVSLRHKDYLFQKRLALRLPFDSFRFDFRYGATVCELPWVTGLKSYRGNHESGGQWRQGGFADDVEDLVTVVAYLRSTYGYEVDMVVGHSRGSVVGMHWLCTSEAGKRVRALVNVSGRYRMHVSLEVRFLHTNRNSFNLENIW